jgi:formate dehydrogenase subunit delta
MSPEKLVHMANQIGQFFATTDGAEQAAASVADHIKKFWNPRMRAAIVAHVATGNHGLDPLVRRAVEQLKEARSQD